MDFLTTKLSGQYVIHSQSFSDSRGSFSRLFCENSLAPILKQRKIVQINHSLSRGKGTIRGLHTQKFPCAEMKIVRCIKGRVFDVAVDIRAGSKTFLQWHGEILSPDNGKALVVPEGFLHGFQVLENDTELLYLHTEFYKPELELGYRYDDPLIGIDWPLPVSMVSEKDKNHSLIKTEFTGLTV